MCAAKGRFDLTKQSSSSSSSDNGAHVSSIKCCLPVRYIVALLVMFSTVNLYMCRYNMSIAIVAMSRPSSSSSSSANKSSTGTTSSMASDVCDTSSSSSTGSSNTSSPTTPSSTSADHTIMLGEFDWDDKTQGMILGSFFYGYILFLVVGGRLSELFGAKWLCSAGIGMSIVINALTPVIARSNQYWLLLASRILLGIFQSFVFPSTYALFSKWAPDHERSTCLSLPYIGGNIGSIASTALSGYLAEHGFAGGWPSVFYVSAILATVWLIIWTIVVKSEPNDHPWITRSELRYIKSNISGGGASGASDGTKPPVPWLSIFSSVPVWACFVAKFTINWNYILLLLKLPSYFSTVFKYPVSKNGLISSLVYVVLTISQFVAGFLADILVRKRVLDKTILRKIFQSIASIGSSVCLATIPLAQCNDTIVIILLLVGMFMFGFYSGGDVPIVADMTNRFAATVFAIGNTIAFICGFVTPLTIGSIVSAGGPDHPRRQWSYVFYISAAINVAGGLVFIVFASARQQHWDRQPLLVAVTEANSSPVTATDGTVSTI